MILIESLYKLYHGTKEVEVLSGLDLHVERGEFAAVLGPSGCGKSTLLNLVGGLDRHYRGSIRVCGRYLEKLKDRELSGLRGARIGFVFQTPVFLSHLRCRANLAFAARFAGADVDPARLDLLLSRVGLESLAQSLPDELSGGQLQRLAVARALAGSPELLLLDEPTGNLDRSCGAALIELLGELHRDGVTLLVVTHDEGVADAADRALELTDGRLSGLPEGVNLEGEGR